MDSITVKLIDRDYLRKEVVIQKSTIKEYEQILYYKDDQINNLTKIVANKGVNEDHYQQIITNNSKINKRKNRKYGVYGSILGILIGILIK